MSSRRSVDVEDTFDRRGPGTRPRSRLRPRYDDARTGLVVGIDRGRYHCRIAGEPVVAMRSRELGRRAAVVGDRVALVGDLSGRSGALARMVSVQPRRTALRRGADDEEPAERVVVANADTLVVVVALADPMPRTGFVDRCLVAAYSAGIRPLICLTKADLAAPDTLLDRYAPLGVTIVPSRFGPDRIPERAGLDVLRDHLTGRFTVLFGQSGVGKSTLLNALIPAADRAVGLVNPVTGRGRHTSSATVALQLPGGGWLVDTPGVRTFGLGHVTSDQLLAAFGDLAPGAADCPRGCEHLEPTCALDEWAEAHGVPPERLASLRRLLQVRSSPEEER